MTSLSRLSIVSATPTTTASVHPGSRSCRRHVVLSAINLAKASRGARERAFLAAEWARGGLTLTEPTVALASRVFGVSQPTINAALEELEQKTIPTPAIDALWTEMSPTERADFFRDHLTEVWTALEMATATT